ncbi:NHL repeat-containing protein [Acidobacteriota bacterium]
MFFSEELPESVPVREPGHGKNEGTGKKRNDRLLTAVIIIVSVFGILYFGYRAISDNAVKNRENPFKYDISGFKKSEKDLSHYSEERQIKINLLMVSGISIGPEGSIYVSGDNRVLIINKDGSRQSFIKTAGIARCLAVDENRDMYLGMTDHIEIYDGKGAKKVHGESLGEKSIITSIAIAQESIFAADAGNRIVWKFDKSGQKQGRIGEKNEAKDIPGFVIPSPYFDVEIDPDGFLWVVNTGRHSLENYTQAGDFRSSWGTYSLETGGFCGCCNPTHIAIMADGSFVTSEKGIVRVKVYNRIGELVSIVAHPDQFAEGTIGLDLTVDSSGRIYVLDPVKKAVRIFKKGSATPTIEAVSRHLDGLPFVTDRIPINKSFWESKTFLTKRVLAAGGNTDTPMECR